MSLPKPVRPSQGQPSRRTALAKNHVPGMPRTLSSRMWRRFAPAPHALSYECHLQEAKERDTSKKIAAARRLTSHNTLPDHDVLLRARLAQSHRRLR